MSCLDWLGRLPGDGFGTGNVLSSVSEAGSFRLVLFRIVLIASPLNIMFH